MGVLAFSLVKQSSFYFSNLTTILLFWVPRPSTIYVTTDLVTSLALLNVPLSILGLCPPLTRIVLTSLIKLNLITNYLTPIQSHLNYHHYPVSALCKPMTYPFPNHYSIVSTLDNPLNTHHMQTCSKSGITKKKAFTANTRVDYLQIKPLNLKIASQILAWTDAMESEFDVLQRQGTWSLVPPPFGHNIIGCRWVYKLKRNLYDVISHYKVRLVAKGFHQQAGPQVQQNLQFYCETSQSSYHPLLGGLTPVVSLST